MMSGWRLTIESPRHIKIEHPTHVDRATLVNVREGQDGSSALTIDYEVAEKVPRTLRTGIQLLFRKALARSVQQ